MSVTVDGMAYVSVYSPQECVSVIQPFEGTGDTEEPGVIVVLFLESLLGAGPPWLT